MYNTYKISNNVQISVRVLLGIHSTFIYKTILHWVPYIPFPPPLMEILTILLKKLYQMWKNGAPLCFNWNAGHNALRDIKKTRAVGTSSKVGGQRYKIHCVKFILHGLGPILLHVLYKNFWKGGGMAPLPLPPWFLWPWKHNYKVVYPYQGLTQTLKLTCKRNANQEWQETKNLFRRKRMFN